MDATTANILNQVTQAFYAAQAASFSATRQSGWPGWERVLQAVPAGAAGAGRVLDVACGNMRFKAFLEEKACAANSEENASDAGEYWAVDSCMPLVGDAGVAASAASAPVAPAHAIAGCPEADRASCAASFAAAGAACAGAVSFVPCDVISTLLSQRVLPFGEARGVQASAQAIPPADITVCFGFFHHVPGQAARIRLLQALCSATRSGGVVAVSLWRFRDNPALAQKAQVSHEAALKHFVEQGICLALDEGDYLLGWQHAQGVFRYCHHFSDADADELAASVALQARLIDRFRADGRTGNLNEYLVFRVEEPK